MGVGRCDDCGSYTEGATCPVCRGDQVVVAERPDAEVPAEPWELEGVEAEAAQAAAAAAARDEREAALRPTNPWAVAALVTGLVGGSLIAMLLGQVALTQIKERPWQRGRGMAIAGIVLGAIPIVVLFGVIVVVAAMDV